MAAELRHQQDHYELTSADNGLQHQYQLLAANFELLRDRVDDLIREMSLANRRASNRLVLAVMITVVATAFGVGLLGWLVK